jgi:hypothetical protein
VEDFQGLKIRVPMIPAWVGRLGREAEVLEMMTDCDDRYYYD